MNRALIGALDGLNTIIAIVIIVAGAFFGMTAFGPGGLVIGIIVGLVAAAVVCGLLAILIEIEKNLRQLVTLQTAAPHPPQFPPTSK